MADSNLPPSAHDINETVLSIRSISTILSKLFPHAGECVRAHRDTRLRTLDDLSLLFVRGSADGKDVVAVTALVANNCITLETIHEAADGRLDVIGNSTESRPTATEIGESPEAVDAFLEDPVLYCMKRGVNNISLEEHARNVQYLLRDLYTTDERTPVQKDASRLRLYIYSYCIAKVHSRFTAKIPGYEGSYRDFFLADEERKIGEIGKDHFNMRSEVSAETPAPSKVGSRDETWIVKFLPSPKDNRDSEWKLSTGTPAVLDLREGQAWRLWSFVGEILGGLFKHISHINQNLRQKCQGLSLEKMIERLDEMQVNLKTIDALMDFLDSLVRASPTFWRLVASVSDLLDKRRGYKTTSFHSSTNEAESGDRIEDEAVDDDVERNLWGNEDSPSAQLRRWLKSLIQWHRAMRYLASGRRTLGILTQHLTITVSVAPPPTQPSRQASLRRTLEPLALSGRISVDHMLDLIRRRATDVYTTGGRNLPRKLGPPKSLAHASGEDGSEWENQFEGHIHCEAYLAAKLQKMNVCVAGLPHTLASYLISLFQSDKALIGVSKRCCYCCALLLQELGLNKDDLVTHGMVYDWTPPEGIGHKVLLEVLKKLQDKLRDCLDEYSSGHRSPNSAAGSDDEVQETTSADKIDFVHRGAAAGRSTSNFDVFE